MENKKRQPGEEPAYLRIYTQMREQITKGIYPYGSKLPSKRALAEEKGVSTITVEHSYAILCDEGYAEARERSGYMVIFKSGDAFALSPSGSEQAVKPIANTEKPLPGFPFSVLAKSMRSVLTEYGEAILIRSENKGCIELRRAIAEHLKKNRGIYVDTEQIIIGSGSEYLYDLIVDILGRDRTFAIESPGYKKIRRVYEAANVRFEMLPLGHDGIESNALRECFADVLHVSPYRSFPSGVTASASKRHEYIRWASKSGRYILEDDFESEFTLNKKSEETLFSISDSENVIYINTFSQTVSSSLRVGYMVIPKTLLKAFDERAGFFSCTVPTYIQLVLARLIDSGDFARHINRVRRIKRKEEKL